MPFDKEFLTGVLEGIKDADTGISFIDIKLPAQGWDIRAGAYRWTGWQGWSGWPNT